MPSVVFAPDEPMYQRYGQEACNQTYGDVVCREVGENSVVLVVPNSIQDGVQLDAERQKQNKSRQEADGTTGSIPRRVRNDARDGIDSTGEAGITFQ